jgi:hypothetical protein
MRMKILALAAMALQGLARSQTNGAGAQSWVSQHLAGWPASNQRVAVELIGKYGPPAASTAQEIVWYGNGPWKRTVLHRSGVLHNFPLPHQDILEQTVSYRVPPDKIADLLSYNGSLVIDRTRGELSVHCDSEQQNTLTLNIADDIVKGERTVDQGLAYHAQVIRGVQIHEQEPYPQQLRFKPQPASATADPGEEAELLRHLSGQ